MCTNDLLIGHLLTTTSPRYVDSAASCTSGQRPWYEAAVAAGDADAQFNVACALLATGALEADAVRARQLMRASALQGHFMAQNAYGLLLMRAEMEARGASDHAGLVRACGAEVHTVDPAPVQRLIPCARPLIGAWCPPPRVWCRYGGANALFASAIYCEAEASIQASAARGYYRAMLSLHARRVAEGGRAAEALAWLTAAAEQRADPSVMLALSRCPPPWGPSIKPLMSSHRLEDLPSSP